MWWFLDGQTDDTWGETLCDLPKVKSYDMTYVELREAARRGDQKLRGRRHFARLRLRGLAVEELL